MTWGVFLRVRPSLQELFRNPIKRIRCRNHLLFYGKSGPSALIYGLLIHCKVILVPSNVLWVIIKSTALTTLSVFSLCFVSVTNTSTYICMHTFKSLPWTNSGYWRRISNPIWRSGKSSLEKTWHFILTRDVWLIHIDGLPVFQDRVHGSDTCDLYRFSEYFGNIDVEVSSSVAPCSCPIDKQHAKARGD